MPFAAPFDAVRACVHARRRPPSRSPAAPELPAEPARRPAAGRPAARAPRRAVVAGDAEGFSAGAHQFDSDITDGRYPRAALGADRGGRLLAVVCDGRADDDAGLTMGELAEAMVALGATHALNLDGGGSTSLVCGGALRNRPREAHGIELARRPRGLDGAGLRTAPLAHTARRYNSHWRCVSSAP